MRCQKDLRTIKWVQQDQTSKRKLVQNGQMTDFGEQLNQLLVKLSLEINVIETN